MTAASAGAVAYDWLLRDHIVGDADSPPEGLTADALENQIRQGVRARKSQNASTILDNKNLLDGAEHVAYTEGKIDSIHALNEQQSQNDVQAAAVDAVDSYETTILNNLFKTWNESVAELDNFISAISQHPELSLEDVLGGVVLDSDLYDAVDGSLRVLLSERTHTLPDGTDFVLHQPEIDITGSSSTSAEWDPADGSSVGPAAQTVGTDGVTYLNPLVWNDLYETITDTMQDVRDGLILWVDNVYSDVQSGEIDVDELITPRERAAMMAEDEGMAQAIADLQALNIPIDVEREATIHLEHVDATIRGTLGITQDQPIESGETYDPETDIDGSVYLTYDVSLGEGTWGAYETGVDGGEVTFTDEPWPGTIYRLDTAAGETVELTADDFTPVDADGDEVDDWEDPDRWLVDITDDVEDAITEVDEVQYFAAEDETQYETIQLQNEFIVGRIEDSDGNEVESMDFQSSEPQSDDNYITQEEWDEMEARNQELIQKYEDSQDSGGGGISLPGFGGDFESAGLGAIAGGVAVVGLAGGVLYQIAKLYLPGN
ncbi:hypothetical protein GRS48_00440 [Halorubrum sp. JWXQ-INN 858]|uniref:hypothetical protein n=1 Tax=Halorubrum sp. JWXQ-INN 858 TaxID=2690782 RepID=UPI001356AC72|nr:hypothetical protein [Halorubrum sp. JWXQ-INN 858]MWV63302.1 hypothetical protein [Halorubrum sp. JWXQ-INN 858]